MAPRLKFLPYALSKTLFNFQQEGVLFGISKDGRCLIADEMGLGKTLQALSIAYYYKNEWPLLIVCPSSMRFPWIEEIEKWLPDIQPGELNLVQSGTDASNIKTSKISIISYGLLSHPSARLLINCLKDTKFGVVVVDESHYMKNRKTARAKALISVIKNTKRAVLLTGTPALARPEELYVQIDVLKPCLLGSFNKFAKRFCEAHTEYICGGRIQKWNTKGASNLEELHDILKTNVMIRRLKRHVLKELPPKRRQKITFDLANVESKKQLAGVIKEFRRVQVQIYNSGSSQNVEKNPVFEMQRLATVLYKQTGISKISAVRQYIADMLDNSDKKFLVFAYHVDVMKAIELEVVKKRVKYIRIAGDVPSILRGSLVQQFQKDSSVRVAILSLLAASVGITLTAADHIIFTELHWTPGIMEQAEDRVHRIGQVNSVLVQYLVAKGTIDEVLWRMLCKKVYVTTATLNGKLQGMDVEEGSEGQSKLLEAFSAWVAEDDEEEDPEEDYLFTHSQKKRKQDVLQRSLTEFFHSPSTSKCRKTDFGKEWAESQESEVNESPVPPVDGKPSSLVVQVDLESVVKEEEKDRPKELDILSGYTQLLSKPKLAKANVVNVSVESTGSNKLSKPLLDKPTNQTEIIDLTGEEEVKQYSDNTEPDESDKNQVDTNCVGVEHPRSRACDVIDNDISDFKTNSSWCCGLCTFSNSGFLRVCEVCGTPRHRSRRKLPNTALSTPKFVKRQQQKILKRSVVAEKKMKSFGRKIKECDVSEERSVLDATVRDINDLRPQPSLAEGTSEHEERPNLESQDVGSFIPESPISDDIPEDLPMINPNTADPGDMSSLAALSNEGASDEFMTSSCESAEDVKAAVDELFLPGNEFDELTADAALSNEGASDEFMTSGCESAEDVKAAVDELFLPGNEFDELTADAALSNEGASDEFMTSGCESAEDVKAAVDELFLPGNEFDELTADAALSNEGASDEFMTSGCESAEDVKAAVDELFLPGNEFDELTADAALSNEGASDEFMTSGCESAEDVKAAVDELFLPGNEFDELTADAALSNEGASDEFMTSGCESAEDVKAAVDELFLPGNEFDELTAEDWWRCESCFKYNYDESATVCEVCGYVKTKPSEHLEDLVQNLEEDWWRCEGCGTFHFDRDVTTCEKCDMVAKHDSEDKKCFVVDWDKYGHLFIEDCEGEMGAPQAMEHLMFCVSCYTDRVYLYNENAEPLNCNVSLLDLDASNVENLPNLLIETSNRKQVMRFMRKWKALSERQRRMIRDTTVVFEDPYEAVELVKTGRVQKSSTCRFPSKETLKEEVVSAATEVNGTVRHCKKTRGKRHKGGVQQSAPPQPSNTSTAAVSAPPNPNQRTWIQAIDDSGRPLCMSCKSPVDTKNTACQWDERFCSHKCKQDYQIRVSGSHVREKLFKEEHGVCQRCSLNAHDLYRSLRLLPKAERREHLENTPFLTLPVTLLNKIIIDPKEGMFWEADHVVPVVEGGGECGLDNYRTLCVPCHRDVTEQLRERLKTNKRLAKPAGTPDITTFFNS